MILKQSTAATVVVGPVLDSAGAAVTTAVAANFSLSKNGTVNALTSETVTHSTNGYYTIALTTSNTDTLGRVEIIVNDSAMSMATHRYNVIVGTSYDLLVTSGGYSTLDAAGIRTAVGLASANLDTQLSTIDTVVDNIEVDTQDIQSRLPAALIDGRLVVLVDAMSNNTITAAALATDAADEIADRVASLDILTSPYGTSTWGKVARDTYLNLATVDVIVNAILADTADMQPKLATAAEIADAVWDEPLTGATHNVSTSAGRRLRQLGDTVILKDGETVAADNAGVINGTNGLGRIKLQPDVGAVCVGQAVRVAGMVRFIEAYDADTQYATVDAPWCTIPEVGDEYTIFNLRTSLIQRITSAASGTIAFVIAKLWDMIEDVSGYRFTADALEEAPTGGGGAVVVVPGIGYAPARAGESLLQVFTGEESLQQITAYESDGTTPLDLSGKTLELVFERYDGDDVIVIEDGDITVSGDDSNIVSFAYPAALTSLKGTRYWALRDAGAPYTVYLQGQLQILRAPTRDA